MTLARMENVMFRYENQTEPTLRDLSFTLDAKDKTGVIGENGAGKTTLLALLRGDLAPTAGSLWLRPRLRWGALPQELRLPDAITVEDWLWRARPDLRALKSRIARFERTSDPNDSDAYAAFYEAGGDRFEALLAQQTEALGFPHERFPAPVSALSGGEKTKLALCAVLATRPDALLLDEPTNHLDQATLEWLETWLAGCDLPMVIVSHDRVFLNRTVNRILALENGSARAYSGHYDDYRRERQAERERLQAAYARQRKKIDQLQRAAAQRRSWAVSHQPQTRHGRGAVYESVTNRARHAMRRAKAVEQRIEMMIEREEAKKPFLAKRREIAVEAATALPNRIALEARGLTCGYGDRSVFSNLDLTARTGERVAVVGPNGSGKSTLLRALAGALAPLAGSVAIPPQARIGFYAQEAENLDLAKTPLAAALGSDPTRQTETRVLLGCLGLSGDKANQPFDALSVGERAKTALAKAILAKPNVLILDEPTNHLSIPAREALEQALLAYPGTILFVSHDRAFQRMLATARFDIETGIKEPVPNSV